MLDFLSKEELIKMIIETYKSDIELFKNFLHRVENDDKFLKIFAFNLGYTLTDEEFRKAFEPFGNIKDSRLARDQGTNKPRGFGFVVFDNPISCLKAFETGVSFDGKPAKLKYQFSSQNAPKSRDPDLKTTVEEKTAKEKRKIHVNGIPKDWKNSDLENYFKKFGEIEEAFVCFEKGTQISRGFGFVTFAKKEDYDNILEPATREEEGFTLTISKVALTAPEERFNVKHRENYTHNRNRSHDRRSSSRSRSRSTGRDHGHGHNRSRSRSRSRSHSHSKAYRRDYEYREKAYSVPMRGYQGYPPQVYPPQGYPPYPMQGYPPQNYPAQQQGYQPGYVPHSQNYPPVHQNTTNDTPIPYNDTDYSLPY